MSTIAIGFPAQAGQGSGIASDIPAELRIPPRPRVAGQARRRRGPQTPAWREAMRWSLLGLTASMAAGEIALALFGP